MGEGIASRRNSSAKAWRQDRARHGWGGDSGIQCGESGVTPGSSSPLPAHDPPFFPFALTCSRIALQSRSVGGRGTGASGVGTWLHHLERVLPVSLPRLPIPSPAASGGSSLALLLLVVLAGLLTVVPMLLATGMAWDQRWPVVESHPLGQNDGSWDEHVIQDVSWISHTAPRKERCSVPLSKGRE